LKDPFAIISFMIDRNIERPVNLGTLLKPEGSPDLELGDWEWRKAGRFFLQSEIQYSGRTSFATTT
jgi:hypothetical protein